MTQESPDRIDPDAPERDRLDGVMQTLAQTVGDADGGVGFGDLMDALGTRGFGPMLLITAALMMLPIANIPFVPAILALAIGGIGVQFLRGSNRIWIPSRLRRMDLPQDKMAAALDRIQRGLDAIRPVLDARLTSLVDARGTLIAIGVTLLVSALLILAIGVVPGLPAILSIHVLLFGIGLAARDGAFLVAGFAWLLPAGYLCWQLGSGML